MSDLLLGIDVGTSRLKVGVFGPDGRLEALSAQECSPDYLPHGKVEIDPEIWWQSLNKAVDECFASVDRRCLRAIGVSSQGGALQILDDSGRPAGPVISWLDGRGRPYDQQITEQIGSEALFARTGHSRGIMALGQLLRLGEQSPELLAPPNSVAFVGDAIVGRLCGRRAHDATSLSCAVVYKKVSCRCLASLLI